MYILPFNSDPVQNFTCQLDDAYYNFKVIYNFIGDYYTIDILDNSGNILVAGVKLVVGANILDGYNLPLFAIVLLNINGSGKDPSEKIILGNDVIAYYLSKEDVDTLL